MAAPADPLAITCAVFLLPMFSPLLPRNHLPANIRDHRLSPKPRPFGFTPNRKQAAIRGSAWLGNLPALFDNDQNVRSGMPEHLNKTVNAKELNLASHEIARELSPPPQDARNNASSTAGGKSTKTK
jgi:hypothetical protein